MSGKNNTRLSWWRLSSPPWSHAYDRGQSSVSGECGPAYLWGFGFADWGIVSIGFLSLVPGMPIGDCTKYWKAALGVPDLTHPSCSVERCSSRLD